MNFTKKIVFFLHLMMIFMMFVTPVYAASDLNISAPDSYILSAGEEGIINVSFSGQGIGNVGYTVSNPEITAEFIDVTWMAYPEICTASIKISTTENFSGGNLTFYLMANVNEVLKSHSIQVSVIEPASEVSDLNIDAKDKYTFTSGSENNITVTFSGKGIDSLGLQASGNGISADIINSTWNPYPNLCKATIKISLSECCTDQGNITFQLKNNNLGIIKEHAIVLSIIPPISQDEFEEQKLQDGYYIFHSKLDENKVIDVKDVSVEDKAGTQLWSNYMNLNQIWYVKSTKDGYYTITAVHSEKMLDVDSGASKSGTLIGQYTPNNTDAQKWKFYSSEDGYIYIAPKCAPHMFLDVKNGSSKNGARLQLYNPNYTDAQKWNIERIGKYKSDIMPIMFKGSMIIECDVELSEESGTVTEGIAEDIQNLMSDGLDNVNILSSNNFYKFMKSDMPSMFNSFDSIANSLDCLPTFSGTLEIPNSVAISIRMNDFNNLNGMQSIIVDDNQRITYITYIYPLISNKYNVVMFEIVEKKSWNTWKMDYIRMAGGFSLKVQ